MRMSPIMCTCEMIEIVLTQLIIVMRLASHEVVTAKKLFLVSYKEGKYKSKHTQTCVANHHKIGAFNNLNGQNV